MSASRTEELNGASGEPRALRFGELVRRRPETITFILLVAICVLVAIANPAFLQPSTLIDIGRASVVMGLFALGVFVILAAGGIDVSFTAIAAFTMYSMTVLVQNHLPGLPLVVILLMAALGGAALGVVNGLLVHHLKVPSLIVTIGTQYLFRGFLLSFIGTVWIMSLPPQMGAFGRMPLFQFESANGAVVTLPFYFLVLPVAAVLTWWILNRTLMGRAIFAVGGNADIASRLGYSLRTVHVSILGVLLIVVINSVLVLVGIPSTWQRLVVGSFILLAAAFFVTRQRKKQ